MLVFINRRGLQTAFGSMTHEGHTFTGPVALATPRERTIGRQRTRDCDVTRKWWTSSCVFVDSSEFSLCTPPWRLSLAKNIQRISSKFLNETNYLS